MTVDDVIDISAKVQTVAVTGPAGLAAQMAYTDGFRFFFADEQIAVIAGHLTGLRDLSGRPVVVERGAAGWQERRGDAEPRLLHRRLIGPLPVYRFDDEWLFTPVRQPSANHR